MWVTNFHGIVVIAALFALGFWLVNRASNTLFYLILAAMLLVGLMEKFGVLNLVN
jgi:cytochrome oxidase assembly protein ShyY1